MIVLACTLLAGGLLAYIFWPGAVLAASPVKRRLDYLYERKEVIFENLRDLNFEYHAGKFPESDYERQRADLESEAATVLAEITRLESPIPGGSRS